jgi:prepilin-type N-terminal cleavage/methylation domain-containing protein
LLRLEIGFADITGVADGIAKPVCGHGKVNSDGIDPREERAGFTLIELLIVVAILGILFSLLLPALARAKEQGQRAVCLSNLRQWGIAVRMYGNDYDDYFPPNLDGSIDVVSHGTNVQFMWRVYLLKWSRTKYNHVLFCPTDKLVTRLNADQKEDGNLYGGYSLLPYRDTKRSMLWDYSAGGIEEWHSKQRFGGEFRGAPIVVDRLHGIGSFSGGKPSMESWMDSKTSLPKSAHAGRGGIPKGGNFLFEDGSVSWFKFQKIEVGSKNKAGTGNFIHFYKVAW